jgi:hypothetical protein
MGKVRPPAVLQDFVICALVSILSVFGLSKLVTVGPADRPGLYSLVLTLTVAFVALAVAPISVMIALSPGRLLRAALDGHKHVLLGAIVSALGMSFATSFGCLIAATLDTPGNPNRMPAHLIVGLVAGLSRSIFRLGRQWVSLVRLSFADQNNQRLLDRAGGPTELRAVS